MELVKVLKALADETRLRILHLLRMEELCVCELENILAITQSNASRHLSKLGSVGLITYTKRAQWVYYSYNRNLAQEFPFLEQLVEAELGKLIRAATDLERLGQYKGSGFSCEDLRNCTVDKSKIFQGGINYGY
ncbi:MAG TPA: metalloregulator ArsR/SmtB family transcription factor [Bacillota bacterium]|nr:metalloregulator ArsR/SmtB family transcription factor [Bacillota bacterium]